MKQVLLLALILGMLFGCGLQESDSEQEHGGSNAASEVSGYVVEEEDERILVVDTESSSTASGGEHYDAVWLSGFSEDVDLGEKVNAGYGDAMEPYPGKHRMSLISK
ncbi:hypothetical protein EPH95_06635 [Salicibibacter halophilus]|uniref:DUF3221 domain-containing protein n=1 Tax=Salicibibacter halophilus TaxID=2502791 RepID=A0A514LH82_9BACI|nr:DUF3221 domain-containing protein [Salicibibacter halophilus]QDI90895.1 hypothetical protein EPH95_06635 [Salicibibacter halophilus]